LALIPPISEDIYNTRYERKREKKEVIYKIR
jgi:hypothetical protein